MTAAAIDLLLREISNPDTQWSLGTFGAIAEFSRDHGEPVRLVQSAEAVSAVTPRGGITLKPHASIRPFASEAITKTGWNQRIALCLPRDDCAMNQRAALTEIGPDRQAPREEDREAILFDLGLAALQADFCVRISDHGLAARLREHAGRSLFEPGNPAMAMILAANPHRVFVSDPRSQSAPRLRQPARPHRGLSADPAAFRQEPGGTAHARAAAAPAKSANPSRHRTGA
jgi:hypothetical protein